MSALIYRPARADDWAAVEALLAACDLPLAGAREGLDDFELAVAEDGALAGCAALELYGGSGLLRSVAVAPEWRGRWIASALVARLLDEARAEGLADVTLFTTTAADYFTRFGFRVIPREDAPEAVRASVEFREACPETATVMTRALA
jgi:N-acetylglutamate synthase-like GNAT family acetyltransferase